MFKFNLGLQVKDKATGFVGVICARAEFQNGQTARQYLLVATDETGCPFGKWYDEDSLELCYGD